MEAWNAALLTRTFGTTKVEEKWIATEVYRMLCLLDCVLLEDIQGVSCLG